MNKTAMAMARCIMENGRRDILYTYPTALYEGEQVEKNMQANIREYLREH